MKKPLSTRLACLENDRGQIIRSDVNPFDLLAQAIGRGERVTILALPKCPGVPFRALSRAPEIANAKAEASGDKSSGSG